MPVAGLGCHYEKGQMLMLSPWFQLGGREGGVNREKDRGKGIRRGQGLTPLLPMARPYQIILCF